MITAYQKVSFVHFFCILTCCTEELSNLDSLEPNKRISTGQVEIRVIFSKKVLKTSRLYTQLFNGFNM